MLFVVVAHAVERRTVVGSKINRRGIIDARVVALVVASCESRAWVSKQIAAMVSREHASGSCAMRRSASAEFIMGYE